MKKMFNKAVLNGTTVMGDGLTYPRIPNVYTGDNEGGYQRGDMMDANAVVEMIKELTDTGKITIDELKNLINEEIQERVEGDQDQQRYTDEKIKDLIGTSPETLDTLKEIADALGEDPDFAANVWNKIAELTTKHNEDVQELQDAITNGFENIDFTPYVKKTDVVTDTTNGLMLASDKQKVDNIPYYLATNIYVKHDSPYSVRINYCGDTISGSHWESNTYMDIASSSLAGAMSASDKQKLDGIEEGAQVNKIESVSVNGTPLEITDKGVNIPIHEYTAGDGIKLENGKFSLDPIDSAGDGYAWGGNVGYYFPIYNDRKLYNTISIYNVAHLNDEFGKLGLLSTSDYNAFKAKQEALTEVQLNNINNAITSISVNDVEQVNTNGTVNLTIPNATTSKAGLMSANDKSKLDYLANEEILAYGVEWDTTSSDPHLTRIGNMSLHKTLPIQSQLKGCIAQKDKVIYWLNESDWRFKKDPETISISLTVDGGYSLVSDIFSTLRYENQWVKIGGVAC